MSLYSVRIGRNPGIYHNWQECFDQVNKFKGAIYKKFTTLQEAEDFYKDSSTSYFPKSNSTSASFVSSVEVSSHTHNLTPNITNNCDRKHNLASLNQASAHTDSIKKRKISTVRLLTLPDDPPPLENCEAVVYTDGCCLNNGTDKAVAGMGVYWGDNSSYNTSHKLKGDNQTNLRAELTAISIALEQAIIQGIHKLEIRSDCHYAIKACSEWMEKWKATNWGHISQPNKEICNKDIIMEIDVLQAKLDKIEYTYVPSHKSYRGNEMADKLANKGAIMLI